jgi:hypothetical protein
VKRAYLDRAMRFHPDRQADAPPDARARADFQMREVNAAWEVLRSPARRAAYDTRLRGDTPVWQSAGTRAKRTAPVTPRVADLEPRQPAGATVSTPSPLRAGPVIVIGVVLAVAALGFAAWATTKSSGGDGTREVEVRAGTPIREGGCVVLASIDGRVTPVTDQCSSVGAFAVVRVVDLGRPCPAGTEEFDVPADELRLCLSSDGS